MSTALSPALPESNGFLPKIKFQRHLEAALGVRFNEPMLTIEDAAAEIRALFQGEKTL